MQGSIFWEPSGVYAEQTAMYRFIREVSAKYGLNSPGYQAFHIWSINNIAAFWEEIWNFCGIKHSADFLNVVNNPSQMPGAKWFEGARLNFAENLLKRDDQGLAIIFRGETFKEKTLTYSELYDEVRKAAAGFKRLGVKSGDRIAAVMPNIPETVIAMLAATSIGAIWTSTSPDFGMNGILDRFTQIEPKIILAADGYYYKGKIFNSLVKINGLLCELPSVEKVILTDYTGNRDNAVCSNIMHWEELVSPCDDPLVFEQLPFDHPVYILYSSGTTGLPKSIVHSAGGTLIQHLKELVLHCDIRRNDKVFYYTTCGWMMWNWFVSALATGATLVLYDGNPFYPKPEALPEMAADLGVSFFGTSAKYLSALESEGVIPNKISAFENLRVIASTGSPLQEGSYDYVYNHWKKDVQLSSISGGTDIISCFFLGNPLLPVRRGEIQCIGLGMDVDCFDDFGNSVRNIQGELVCKSAFPSMPVFFWNDPEEKKYRSAYFEIYPGIWRHGDFIVITNHGGVVIHGRSDSTLNPQGVRIGTAEIYRIVEEFAEIEDSVVAGLNKNGDEHVVLFVKMKKDVLLTHELKKRIGDEIVNRCTPRHKPAYIVETPDIPYTRNGKKVEVAVKQAINGTEVKNAASLVNPSCLDYYYNILKFI